MLPPPPYVMRLAERPQDQAEFDDFVNWLIWRCRPGRGYRVPLWASPARRRQARRRWENTVRIFVGRTYELGRR